MTDNTYPNKLANIISISETYDTFFIDIWGVLHDGMTKYPGAEDALRWLKTKGKKIILLSNAPRRASLVQEKMQDIGYADDLYDHIVSSGEAVRHYLISEYYGAAARGKYYMIGGSRDGDLLEYAEGFTRVYNIASADFVLLTGYNDSMLSHEDVLPTLEQCLERRLFIVNANPDKRIERISGESIPCAGSIVDAYRAMGGEAVETGKPFKEMYQFAAMYAGVDVHTTSCACIGDNMDTDIKGAIDNAMDGYLVASGMHHKMIGRRGIDAFLKDYTTKPTGVLKHFST